jgi:hypothetical protein
MTRIEALKELAEKVEAGTLGAGICGPLCGSANIPAQHVIGAFNGWLDKANDLHSAVLPGWHFSVSTEANKAGYVSTVSNPEWTAALSANSDNPARAWLQAILRALIDMEERL